MIFHIHSIPRSFGINLLPFQFHLPINHDRFVFAPRDCVFLVMRHLSETGGRMWNEIARPNLGPDEPPFRVHIAPGGSTWMQKGSPEAKT